MLLRSRALRNEGMYDFDDVIIPYLINSFIDQAKS